VAFGPRIQNITGGYFDVILPVQRGTQDGDLLEFTCYANEPGFPASPEFQSAKAADTQSATNWANAEILANDCYAAQNLTGEFLGSAFDARDWMGVVDALGEDGLLRYYGKLPARIPRPNQACNTESKHTGVSAGTTLGNHLVSMFPDRVDKVILDGVVNPHEYVRNAEVEVFDDADKAFSAFCAGCVAAPINCTLGINTTAEELESGIKTFIDGLLEDPIPLSFPGVVGGFLVDYQTVKQLIYGTLYYPAQWPGLATQIEALLTRNSTLIAALLGAASTTATADTSRTEAQNGIKCSDQDKYALRSEWEVVQSGRHNRSYFGDVADVVVSCARWKLDAKERYAGNFTAKTRNPVLLIGNTADPITPIASARNASAGYEGSVVLEHGSYGVSSLSPNFVEWCRRVLTWWWCSIARILRRGRCAQPRRSEPISWTACCRRRTPGAR
jgi:pimeloyl-ACP methyl ester carboxylesterase